MKGHTRWRRGVSTRTPNHMKIEGICRRVSAAFF
jgi:hypothetical protein